MGIQVTRDGKILVGGEKPKGLHARLRAWWTVRSVNRLVAKAKSRSGMSPEQKAALDRDDEIRYCRRFWKANALYCTMSLSGIATNAYVVLTGSGLVRLAMVPISAFLVWNAYRDYVKALALRQRERELIVDEVHEF